MKLRLLVIAFFALGGPIFQASANECSSSSCGSCIDCPPLCINQCCDSPLHGKTFLLPRSQGVNIARDLVGWHRFINRYDEPGWYWAWNFVGEFSRTYRPKRIAEYFFGTNCLNISGSQVIDRSEPDILADYFGLSPEFVSDVFVDPYMINGIIDGALYVGWRSLYFRLHAPIVWTRTSMGLRENVINPGIATFYPPLYMSVPAIPAPATSFIQAMQGGFTYGDVREGLQYGKIACPQSRFGLADIHLALGWNFVTRRRGHVGFNILGVIPTGNRSKAEYLFEPVIGNGHHGEVGLGFTGHVIVWEKDGQQTVGIHSEFNASTLFKSRQRRSFDLCKNGWGSRYTLLKTFDQTGNYTTVTVPAINRLTFDVNVHIDLQFDFVIMAAYTYCNWGVDLGYNGWIRSREKITDAPCLPPNTYGMKGIQNCYTQLLTPSNATESCATIYGTNFFNQACVVDADSPVFITSQALNIHSAATNRPFTHKIFGNLQYSGERCSNWFGTIDPFIGAGGEVEFEGLRPLNRLEPNKISVSQWGIWLKGGISY